MAVLNAQRRFPECVPDALAKTPARQWLNRHRLSLVPCRSSSRIQPHPALAKWILWICSIGMFDIRSLDFRMLLTLEALYEEQSVSRAAERLRLAQSTVSGTLKRLREIFNDPLFIRSGDGMVPTARADELVPVARRILRETGELFDVGGFDPETQSLTVRLCANDYSLQVLIAPFVKRLRAKAPRMRLAVLPFETTELAAKLSSREIDAAVTIPEMAPPDYPSRALFRDRYVIAVRPGHPLIDEDNLLEGFCRYDHVLVSPVSGSFEGPVDRALREIGRRRNVVLALPSFQALSQYLYLDDLIAVVPERLLADTHQPLRKLDLPVRVSGPDAILVWHPRLSGDTAFDWFKNELITTSREDLRA